MNVLYFELINRLPVSIQQLNLKVQRAGLDDVIFYGFLVRKPGERTSPIPPRASPTIRMLTIYPFIVTTSTTLCETFFRFTLQSKIHPLPAPHPHQERSGI